MLMDKTIRGRRNPHVLSAFTKAVTHNAISNLDQKSILFHNLL